MPVISLLVCEGGKKGRLNGENYENEVYELDTDDPFYGLYVEMENLENE